MDKMKAPCPDDESKAMEKEESAAGNEDAAKQAAPEQTGKPEEESNSAEAGKPAGPDWKDLYARTLADFDNFKKRTARDRDDTYRYAEADILKDILPAIDNLALALAAADRDDAFVKGVRMAYDTFLAALKERGAEPFDSVGKPLDTAMMEAVAQLPNAEYPEGIVTNEVKRGWMLKGKTLRAAQVVTSAGAPSAQAQPTAAPADDPDETKGGENG